MHILIFSRDRPIVQGITRHCWHRFTNPAETKALPHAGASALVCIYHALFFLSCLSSCTLTSALLLIPRTMALVPPNCACVSLLWACHCEQLRLLLVSVQTDMQLCSQCEYLAKDLPLCPQGVCQELCMFCQVAQTALQVWAKGSRAAEALLDTSVQERTDLEAALKDVLLPHLSKMSAEAFQVRLLLCQHKKNKCGDVLEVHCQDHQSLTNALTAQVQTALNRHVVVNVSASTN